MATEEVELVRLKADFVASCQAVHASSVQLHKIHAFLMKELLDLESDKRRSLARRIGEMEQEVAEMRVRGQQDDRTLSPSHSPSLSLPLSLHSCRPHGRER